MALLKSEGIITTLIGIIFSFLFFFLSISIKLNSFTTVYIIIVITFIIFGAFLWAFNKKTNEINEKLEIQKIEQIKLMEKLKIHEQLIDIKVDIKQLQKQIFKNE